MYETTILLLSSALNEMPETTEFEQPLQTELSQYSNVFYVNAEHGQTCQSNIQFHLVKPCSKTALSLFPILTKSPRKGFLLLHLL